MRTRLVALALCLLVVLGCDTESASDAGTPPVDTGPRPDTGATARSPCQSALDLEQFFASNGCIACHGGATAPDLRFDALEALASTASTARPGHALVVPSQPMESELYLRVAGPRPADATGSWWMPLGAVGPHPQPDPVAAWIERGAEVWCEGTTPPPPPPEITNPNLYPQDMVFACADPSADTSSPARLRRIDRREFAYASGTPLDRRWTDGVVAANPLETPPEHYSTYTGVDTTTLQLLLVTMPEAAQPWTTRGQGPSVGGRWWTVYSGTPASFYAENPSEADRDAWVDTMLLHGALFRAPTPDEHARVRALLDAEIEAEGTYSAAVREETLRTVVSAARLMSGALFRSEMGTGEGARRRLGDQELGLAVGRFLGAHPVSSTLWGDPPTDATGHPDWSREDVSDGRLAEVADAVADGTIGEPDTLRTLFRRYRGGLDPSRVDLMSEEFRLDERERGLRERGEYWLSEGITRFFREWFDVDGAEVVFKDTPNATSRWVVDRSNAEATGYDLITSAYSRETLLPLFDDTVARAVVEAEMNHEDVFHALLTARTFRVASNLLGVDRTRPCTQPSDCGDSRVGSCYVSLGFCTAFGQSEINRVFGVTTDVDDTRAARWITLPESERAGLLTHPAWLAAHGNNFEDDASLVHRGHWIRESLLCDDVPGLELVSVPAMLGPRAADRRARDRVHDATEQEGSACVTCHAEMNPYGYPFEIYNHAGFLRADDHGHAPDGSTTITNAPAPELNRSYTDAIDFVEALADSPYARRCFIRNVFRHFLGRNETPADACTLAAMETAFASGSFFAMLETLLTSDAFLYRHDGGAP
ncbi:MAG: DUF1588 domain-containing protein [Sandaracinaceae bacterium]|nr:DUF1588 domain-containing protein [Sandaracinaceae bacterium]